MRHAFRILQALCLGLSFVAVADGAPIADLSRTSIVPFATWGGKNVDEELVRITNVGSDPLVISSISSEGNGPALAISADSCRQAPLAPGEGCSLIVHYERVGLSGGEGTKTLYIFTNAADSPHYITVAPFVLQAPSVPNPVSSFPLAAPSYLEFGNVAVGTPAPSRQIVMTNSGNGPALNLASIKIEGRHPNDFAVAGSCNVGTVLTTNATCTFDVTFMPSAAGPRSAEIYILDPVWAYVRLPLALVGYGTSARPTAQAIEFYHHDLDHYFLTHIAAEIAKLDAGTEIKGWTRTGQSITVATTSDNQTSPVCRFYIPPELGNSHFYGRGIAECASTGQKNPSFVDEDAQFFHMVLPAAGVCPAGTSEVYRVFSNRADANHRYMTDKAIRDQMVAKGWLAEGDGADLVVMCAPQ